MKFKKLLHYNCFPWNFTKISWKPFLYYTYEWLLLVWRFASMGYRQNFFNTTKDFMTPSKYLYNLWGKLKKHKLLFCVDTKPWIYDVMLQLINIIKNSSDHWKIWTVNFQHEWQFLIFHAPNPKNGPTHTICQLLLTVCWVCLRVFVEVGAKRVKQTFWMKNFAWTFCLMAQWVR